MYLVLLMDIFPIFFALLLKKWRKCCVRPLQHMIVSQITPFRTNTSVHSMASPVWNFRVSDKYSPTFIVQKSVHSYRKSQLEESMPSRSESCKCWGGISLVFGEMRSQRQRDHSDVLFQTELIQSHNMGRGDTKWRSETWLSTRTEQDFWGWAFCVSKERSAISRNRVQGMHSQTYLCIY